MEVTNGSREGSPKKERKDAYREFGKAVLCCVKVRTDKLAPLNKSIWVEVPTHAGIPHMDKVFCLLIN